MAERIIVDENDNPIGVKQTDSMQYEDIYRVSALWITDSNTGESLIAQRQKNKRNDPNKWATAVAGTVEYGETYEANIQKEAAEELGLHNLDLKLGPKQYIDDGNHKFFCQWFLASIDRANTKITLQEEEVQDVAWINNATLRIDVEANLQKYLPSTIAILDLLGI